MLTVDDAYKPHTQDLTSLKFAKNVAELSAIVLKVCACMQPHAALCRELKPPFSTDAPVLVVSEGVYSIPVVASCLSEELRLIDESPPRNLCIEVHGRYDSSHRHNRFWS